MSSDFHLTSAEVHMIVGKGMSRGMRNVPFTDVVEFVEFLNSDLQQHPSDFKKLIPRLQGTSSTLKLFEHVYEAGFKALMTRIEKLGEACPEGVLVQNMGLFTKNGTNVWEIVHEESPKP